ncbi:MAG: hypothetical protein WDO15_17520 [Bacteroidota bacterium]
MAKVPVRKLRRKKHQATEENPLQSLLLRQSKLLPKHHFAKLRELNIDHQLQSEIDWCLASYRGDGNPVGLYQMVERAVEVFKAEQQEKTKGVTASLSVNWKRALAAR